MWIQHCFRRLLAACRNRVLHFLNSNSFWREEVDLLEAQVCV
jgi:hypothetical protein